MLAETLAERPSKNAVIQAVDTLAKDVNKRMDSLQSDVTAIKTGQERLEAMLGKLLDGQAVLHQNDMELKRRLDFLGSK